MILQGFKLIFRPPVQCSLIASLPLFYGSLGEDLGETRASRFFPAG